MDRDWYIKFEPDRWKADPLLALSSASTRGVWIEWLCSMFLLRADHLTASLEQLAVLARVTLLESSNALDQVRALGIANVHSNENGTVTVVSRYLSRKRQEVETARKQDRERQARHRSRGKNQNVTPLSRDISELELQTEQEKKKTNPPNPPAGGVVSLPAILDTPEFRSAWADWQEHRRQIRKPLKPKTLAAQLAKLESFGATGAVASIRASIEAGWTGLFDPPQTGGNGVVAKPRFETDNERSMRLIRERSGAKP